MKTDKVKKLKVDNDFKVPKGAGFLRRFLKILFFVPYRLLFWTKLINKKELKQHKKKGVIFCLNHRSFSDVPTVFVTFPTVNVNFIAKESLFKNRLVGWFFRSLNGVPIRFGVNELAVIRDSIGKLKKNKTMLIFPEGRRNFNSEDAMEIKGGASMIALRSGCPVVPMVTNRPPRPFKLTKFKIGQTILMDKYKAMDDQKEALKLLSHDIQVAMAGLLEGFEHKPRLKKWEMMPVDNARGIVFVDDKIVLMERNKENRHFFTLPGGKVENNEMARNAAVREIKEEVNLEVEPIRLLYKSIYKGQMQAYFLCKHIHGEVSKTDAEEYTGNGSYGTYEPVLRKISDIGKIELMPPNVKKQLAKDIQKYGTNLGRPTKFVK